VIRRIKFQWSGYLMTDWIDIYWGRYTDHGTHRIFIVTNRFDIRLWKRRESFEF